MGVRHRGRELAFQIIFQIDQTGDKVNAVIARFQELKYANKEAASLAEELSVGAAAAMGSIDALIRGASDNWKLERLLSVDRALLRLGVHELAHVTTTPIEVILDECIELAKDYGSDESAAFVNGILDSLAKKLRPNEPLSKRPASPKKVKRAKAKAKKA